MEWIKDKKNKQYLYYFLSIKCYTMKLLCVVSEWSLYEAMKLLCSEAFMCVLQLSRTMSASGIFWSTPPVKISGGRHWKARSLLWNLLILLSGYPDGVWYWLLMRKPHSWALSFNSKQCRDLFVTLCLVSLNLCAILWPSELLSSCICFSTLIHMGVLILWVCFLYF